MVELEQTRLMLENLGLSQAAITLDSHLDYAARSEITYLEFINRLLKDEADFRRKRSEETRLKLSRLPHKKTLDEFDFSFQPSLDERQIRELATLSFIHRQENVILLGPPGVGKSHIAIGLAVEAIRQGLSVYFVSMDKLLDDLRRANNEGRLHHRWKVYQRPGLLVIDEIGYSQLDRVSGNLFFQLICSRYEKGSMILTSNKGFGEWGDLMGDVPLATAILDRLLHHAHVVNIRGQSYRIKARVKASGSVIPQQFQGDMSNGVVNS
jgi:DNA replication protein DnaC